MATAQKLQILLIEDDLAQAGILELYLETSSEVTFELCHVVRLEQGLAHLDANPIDCVLLDLSLPDSKGMESLNRVRSNAPNVPVIVLTGTDDDATALEAVRLGAQDYLVKGDVTNTLLIRTILYAVERSHIASRLRQRQAELDGLTGQMPVCLWMTDQNLELTSLVGTGFFPKNVSVPDSLGRNVIDLFPEGSMETPIVDVYQLVLEDSDHSFDLHVGHRIFHIHIEPYRSTDGSIIGTLGVAVDITERERMRSEFSLARTIQKRLWPKEAPSIPGWDIAGASFPAEATSGDHYDYIPLWTGDLLFVLGDASGHGFGTALLMASMRAHLRALAKVHIDLAELTRQVNLLTCEEAPEDRFATLSIIRLEPSSRRLMYCNAGHPAGVVLDREGNIKQRLSNTASLPLGIDEGAQFKCGPILSVEPEDTLLFVSDGALDAFNADEEQYGEERLFQSVRDALEQPARQIVSHIYHSIREFAGGPPHDDVTAIVAKFLPC